ncbi:MAG: hypothetical protein JXB85_17420, partial [Anaerolineales bacterium]|nr:hypothetical protein [Anaerolineales bacterium]
SGFSLVSPLKRTWAPPSVNTLAELHHIIGTNSTPMSWLVSPEPDVLKNDCILVRPLRAWNGYDIGFTFFKNQ